MNCKVTPEFGSCRMTMCSPFPQYLWLLYLFIVRQPTHDGQI